ncbi:helix-turn-helix domain-containing protein [Streptomyces chattanoogensis]|uniref:XRE family transcriptional regulator n=1 Tax=Streptomyces chattanoogensis TaxID=66876 RepID=A0A0N0GXL6_9ACTN|nr:helix-turn-helix transcriptional regulator [Streptomyces chattanoogensis]KPC61159.1 XRE family transcriptional regulator [Streptomyces chattanoogensis]
MAGASPPVWRRRLAAKLVEFREQAGRSPEEAAERIGCHRTKINRVENARLGISLGELRDLLTFYEVDDPDEVDDLVSLARRRREPAWVRRAALVRPSITDLIHYEESAACIRSFHNTLITGLLQTPDYARAVLSTRPSNLGHEGMEALFEARMKRQEVLERADPPRLYVVENEAALRVQVGGRQAMRKQLEHLEAMAGHPSVEIRVIPDRAGAHAGLTCAFVLFSFPNPTYPEVVSVEHRTGMLYMEAQEETAQYAVIFDSLQSVTLSPADSVELIAEVRRSM